MSRSKNDIYQPQNLEKDSVATHTSPSGKYHLVTMKYRTGQGTWSYSLGEVFNADGKLLGRVERNFGHFPFGWVEGHPDGHDYLLCGEHYQGLTVIRLDDGVRVDWLKPLDEKGHRWGVYCFSSFLASPDKTKLICDVTIWGGPGSCSFFDLSNPMVLPWPELLSFEGHADENINMIGFFQNDVRWDGNDAVILGVTEGDDEDRTTAAWRVTIDGKATKL